MSDKKVITPCAVTKGLLTKHFRKTRWLEEDEEIYAWDLSRDVLTFHIRREKKRREKDEGEMKAILDIHGWRKEAEIDSYALYKGFVVIGLLPPLSAWIRHEDKIGKSELVTSVKLTYWGTPKGEKLPVFGYNA